MLKTVKKSARFILPTLLLGFIVLNIIRNKDLVLEYWKNFDLFFLVISYVFMVAIFVEAGLNWHELIKRIGYPLEFKKSLYIFITSNASRYIPGSIWQYIGRIELAKKTGGIPRKTAIISLVLEGFILINAAFLVSFLALPYLNQEFSKNYLWILAIPLSLTLFHPSFAESVIKLIAKISGKDIGNITKINISSLILVLPFFVLNFILNGVALFFLTRAIFPEVGIENIIFFSGIFAFSWAVGFLSLFAPAGLGVTDLLLAYLLSFQIPFALASVVALFYRVLLTVAELTVFLYVMKINFNDPTVNYLDIKQAWEKRSKKFGYKIEGVTTKSLPPQVNSQLDNWMLNNIKEVISDSGDKKNTRILDLGCGYGRLSKPLLESFPNIKVFGIDVSNNYVALYNKDLGPRGKAMEGDIRRLPYKSSYFDSVFMVTTLMYLAKKKDQKKAVKEILRVLKPGGNAIVIERSPSGYFLFTLGGLVNFIRGEKNQEITAVSINKEEFKENVKSADGIINNVYGIPFFSLFLPFSVILYKIAPHILGIYLNPIKYLDKKFKSFLWPSLYLSYTISKPLNLKQS